MVGLRVFRADIAMLGPATLCPITGDNLRHVGEPILFDWIETLKRKLETLSDALDDFTDDGSSVSSGHAHDPEAVSQDDVEREAGRVQSVAETSTPSIEVVHGQPFTEKKSTFQAHLCHVVNMDEVGKGEWIIVMLRKTFTCMNGVS